MSDNKVSKLNTALNAGLTTAPRRIVDSSNNPIPTQAPEPTKEQQDHKRNIVAALQHMVDGITDGSMKVPDRIIVMPQFQSEVTVIVLGDEVPREYIEGVLHKALTRMALQ